MYACKYKMTEYKLIALKLSKQDPHAVTTVSVNANHYILVTLK